LLPVVCAAACILALSTQVQQRLSAQDERLAIARATPLSVPAGGVYVLRLHAEF
jgi:hypothetical protein